MSTSPRAYLQRMHASTVAMRAHVAKGAPTQEVQDIAHRFIAQFDAMVAEINAALLLPEAQMHAEYIRLTDKQGKTIDEMTAAADAALRD